jgi:hypothetical protein
MTLKTRLNEILNYMREQELAFPDYLTEEERNQTGSFDNWSAKDEIIHMNVWANRHLDNLELILSGGTAPDPIFGELEDQANREIFDTHKDYGWKQARQMVHDTYDRVTAYVNDSSEDLLLETPPGEERPIWRMIAGSHITHPMIHLWSYLQRHEYNDLLIALFGENFVARLVGMQDDKTWRGTAYYNLACIYALSGEKEKAIAVLAKSLQLAPQMAEWSKQDSDLAALHNEPEFQELFEE